MSVLEVRSPRHREVRELPEVTQFGTAGSLVCSHSSLHVCPHVLPPCRCAVACPFCPRTLSLPLEMRPTPWVNPVNRKRAGVSPVKARVALCPSLAG